MPKFDQSVWFTVRLGESGDAVYRRRDGAVYAKAAGPGRRAELEGERDRLSWLEQQGIACPRVLDWLELEACLVTSTMPGVPASELSGDDLFAAWTSITAMIGTLHQLDPRLCPFSRKLDRMLARARDVVSRDAVNADFLSDADRSVPSPTLLTALEDEAPAHVDAEATSLTVCHGDATMPNLMVNPGTLRCTGLIDLGRLGTADPYADFSLMLANAGEQWTSREQADSAFDALFRRLGQGSADRERLAFYLRLDPLTWG